MYTSSATNALNFSFEKMDAKSILPPPDRKSWKRWDGTTYHGSSMLALYYLFNRFGYSMLLCNIVNCFAVKYKHSQIMWSSS